MTVKPIAERILITGGSGFIGTNLVNTLLEQGKTVLNVDIRAPRNLAHKHVWRQHDILDKSAIVGVVREFEPECVFHLAARTDLNGKNLRDYEANTVGVQNVIEGIASSPVTERAIFASSMLVCRLGYQPKDEYDHCPPNAYGESKVRGEDLVRREMPAAVPWVIVRPTSLWGPWFDIPYRKFFTAIQHGLYFHPRGRQVYRNYGFVLNAVYQLECIMRAEVADIAERTVYLADYEPTELRQWGEMIRAELGVRRIREIPLGVLKPAAKIGDLLLLLGVLDPPLSSRRLENLLTNAILDISSTRALCGKLPYDLQQGVRMTVEWMRSAGLAGPGKGARH